MLVPVTEQMPHPARHLRYVTPDGSPVLESHMNTVQQ